MKRPEKKEECKNFPSVAFTNSNQQTSFSFCAQVIWRYKGEPLKKLSANTRISEWIPQNDLLGAHTHSNTHTYVNPSKKKTHK